MPYLVKSKGSAKLLRDPSDGKMYRVTNDKWSGFLQLPKGTVPEHDADLLVEQCDESTAKKSRGEYLGKKPAPRPAPKKTEPRKAEKAKLSHTPKTVKPDKD